MLGATCAYIEIPANLGYFYHPNHSPLISLSVDALSLLTEISDPKVVHFLKVGLNDSFGRHEPNSYIVFNLHIRVNKNSKHLQEWLNKTCRWLDEFLSGEICFKNLICYFFQTGKIV